MKGKEIKLKSMTVIVGGLSALVASLVL